MKRAIIIFLAVFFVAAPAYATKEGQPLPETWEEWALSWQNRMERAWDPWAVAWMCLADEEYCWGPDVYCGGEDLTDAEWEAWGRKMRALTTHYEALFKNQWRRMTHPQESGIAAWRPLAEWVCHYAPDSCNTTGDAKKILRALRKEYGPDPQLAKPHATMRRIYRRYFKTHKHAPEVEIEIEVVAS